MELQMYSGEGRPAPFYCSLALSPLSPPILLLFFLLSVALFHWLSSLIPFPPLCLSGPSHPFLPTGASFLLLCSASPGPGVWAALIAEEKQQPIHLRARGLPMKREEQRSSFITIAINNANSTAVEAGEREVAGTGTGGYRAGTAGARQWSMSGGLGGPVARQSWRSQRSDRFTGQTAL